MPNINQKLLAKLGLRVMDVKHTHVPLPIREMTHDTMENPVKVITEMKVEIDDERFYSMCHLIRFTDMMCESKNPAVHETYNHLITLLELSK